MSQPTCILYCNCSYAEVVPAEAKGEVLERLHASGIEFQAVADLCELSARRSPTMMQLAEAGDLRIAACYPRAVRWLFHAAGAPLNTDRARVFNMRAQGPNEVVAGLLANGSGQRPDGGPAHAKLAEVGPIGAQPGAWVPWFPVIDYDRCTDCKQCLSFCLFGVYGLNADDRVEVRHPDHCKTGCPACSRVCPNLAIMFPKYGKSPVNGDTVHDGDVKREPVKVDVSALVGGDIHAALRARRRKTNGRFSVKWNPAEALAQRREQLQRMQVELDIPEEVLQALRPQCDRACECDCDCVCEGDGPDDCGCDCECYDQNRSVVAGEQPGESQACCDGDGTQQCGSMDEAADV